MSAPLKHHNIAFLSDWMPHGFLWLEVNAREGGGVISSHPELVQSVAQWPLRLSGQTLLGVPCPKTKWEETHPEEGLRKG